MSWPTGGSLLAAGVEVVGITCVSWSFQVAQGSEASICVAIFGLNSVLVPLIEFAYHAHVPSSGKIRGILMCLCSCELAILELILKKVVHLVSVILMGTLKEYIFVFLMFLIGVLSAISIQMAPASVDPRILVVRIEAAKLVLSQFQLAAQDHF